MRGIKSSAIVVAMLWALCFTSGIYAQTIDAGTAVTIRTNENIEAKDTDGRVFTGVVDQDVRNRNGNLVIPRGSNVELLVRKASNTEVALDLDSITINGVRYGV